MTGQAQQQSKDGVASHKAAAAKQQGQRLSKAQPSEDAGKPAESVKQPATKPSPNHDKQKPQVIKQAPVIPLHKDLTPKDDQNTYKFLSIDYFRNLRPQQFRRVMLALSLLIMVVLPAIIGSSYFLFWASDRYSTKIGFAVRSVDNVAVGSEFLGALTGAASSGSTTTDNYILLEYLKSRELLEKLSKDFDFRTAFSNSEIDYFYRLDPALPIEEIVEYWAKLISTTYDNTSGIITIEIQGFTPRQSHTVAELVLQYSNDLVNTLSAHARQDTEKFAKQELARAELRLRFVRDQMQEFRQNENIVDPTLDVQAQVALVSGLEQQLVEVRARLDSITGIIEENSPTFQQLKRREKALLSQIVAQKQLINGGARISGENPETNLSSLSSALKSYETLQLDLELAQKGYAMALSSLEKARAEASRQQRYLAVYQPPKAPDSAIYPHRALNSFVLVVLLIVVWSVGSLLVYSVRDHMRWKYQPMIISFTNTQKAGNG